MRFPWTLSLILAGNLLLGTEAKACSCILPTGPDDAFHGADAVFRGRVIAMESFGPKAHGYRVTFEVIRPWKGPAAARLELGTGEGGGDCGFPFEVGQEYVVYAEWSGDVMSAHFPTPLYTHTCTRTLPTHAAAEDLAYLEKKPDLRELMERRSIGCASCSSFDEMLGFPVALAMLWRRRRCQKPRP